MSDDRTAATPAGVPDYDEFLAQTQPGRSRRSLLRGSSRRRAGVLGVYESDDDEGHVRVRLDTTEEAVRVHVSGFPAGFQFLPGDELGVIATGDELHTAPHVRRTVRRGSRTEFWTVNRYSGEFRLLHRRQPDDTGAPGTGTESAN